MKLYDFFMLSSCLIISSCASQGVRAPANNTSNDSRSEFIEMVDYPSIGLKLRAGYFPEANALKGCVLFLQGLGDSVLNHRPYFSRLSNAGYRVIFFDYMGQGGSEGSMNDTRVKVELPANATSQMIQRHHARNKFYEIPVQGEFIWNRYKNVTNDHGQNCSTSKKLVIGWSTGGLSAYRMAYEKRADAVALIAPGIHPKLMVGEFFKITEASLTRNRFSSGVNPHVDPVKPSSPVLVPQFAGNLIGISHRSRNWKIDSSVAGIVFLSGEEDTYVDREATAITLNKNANHFHSRTYDGALHELDNELSEVADDVHERTIQFFDSVTSK